jgi:hypothetical protein
VRGTEAKEESESLWAIVAARDSVQSKTGEGIFLLLLISWFHPPILFQYQESILL